MELWWERWKPRSSHGFSLATDPTPTTHCGLLQGFLTFWPCFDLAHCKEFFRDRNCFIWTPRCLWIKVLGTLIVVVKRVLLYFERPLEKFDHRFGLSKQLKKHCAPPVLYTSNFDRKCKFALASRRSVGPPLARGPIRRNRSNRLETDPGGECVVLLGFNVQSDIFAVMIAWS